VQFGRSEGMPFNLITNLKEEDLRSLLFRFFADSTPEEVSLENAWQARDCTHPADVRETLQSCGNPAIKLNTHFLHSFSEWAKVYVENQHHKKFVYGAIVWLGMKRSWKRVLSLIQRNIHCDNIVASNFHLGFEISHKSQERIVTLNTSLKQSFKGKGSEFYRPLGMSDNVSAIYKDGSNFVSELSRKTNINIHKIRMYNPPLLHCRVSNIRNQRAICAAATLVGGKSVKEGPYLAVIQKSCLVTESIESGLKHIQRCGSQLRLEVVVRHITEFTEKKIFKLKKELISMIFPHIDHVSIHIFPFEREWQTCLQLLKGKDIHHFCKIVAAESYLTMVMDGGTLRLYYPGLKSALGSTIGVALSLAKDVILPATQDLNHTNWESLSLDKLSEVMAYYLGVSAQVVYIVLHMIQRLPPDPNSEKHAKIWMALLMRLESIRCGIPSASWNVDYHSQQRSLSGAISPLDLASILLHNREKKGLRHYRQHYFHLG
jgi:hypothetical protein